MHNFSKFFHADPTTASPLMPIRCESGSAFLVPTIGLSAQVRAPTSSVGSASILCGSGSRILKYMRIRGMIFFLFQTGTSSCQFLRGKIQKRTSGSAFGFGSRDSKIRNPAHCMRFFTYQTKDGVLAGQKPAWSPAQPRHSLWKKTDRWMIDWAQFRLMIGFNQSLVFLFDPSPDRWLIDLSQFVQPLNARLAFTVLVDWLIINPSVDRSVDHQSFSLLTGWIIDWSNHLKFIPLFWRLCCCLWRTGRHNNLDRNKCWSKLLNFL